jgi:hypothetical protein
MINRLKTEFLLRWVEAAGIRIPDEAQQSALLLT